MIALNRNRYSLSAAAAIAILSACAASQPVVGNLSPGAAVQAKAHHAASKSLDLLYVVTSDGIDILAYPGYKKIGTLWAGRHAFGPITSNPSNGNILVDVGAVIDEYAHGGRSPIAQIGPVDGYAAIDYAFDPNSGDIAVAYSGGEGGMVDVYTSPSGTPATYDVPNMAWPAFVGYDNQGNLFVDGRSTANGPDVLAELVKGAGGFNGLSLNTSIENMGSIQWDGSNITVASGATIDQLSISGSNATVVGTTNLSGAWARWPIYWIQGGTIIGDHVTTPHTHNGRFLGLWNYPQGGKAFRVITSLSPNKHVRMSSEAVSIGTSK